MEAAVWSVTLVDITPDHTASRSISENNLQSRGICMQCITKFLILVHWLVRSASIVLSFEFPVSFLLCVCVCQNANCLLLCGVIEKLPSLLLETHPFSSVVNRF
jgi:hypothetical protein